MTFGVVRWLKLEVKVIELYLCIMLLLCSAKLQVFEWAFIKKELKDLESVNI